MLDGKPAKNRHFLLDRGLYLDAAGRCEEDGISLSDVLRYAISQYGAQAPAEGEMQPALDLLPARTLVTLKSVWNTRDSDYINQYLAALHRAGWTVRTIAESLVACEAVPRMTRQAVSLRVLKAPEDLRPDLPEVPELGPRRPIVSSKKPGKRKSREEVHDMAFRVTDEDYLAAARRDKHEGAMISSVLDKALLCYTNGEFDHVFRTPGGGKQASFR